MQLFAIGLLRNKSGLFGFLDVSAQYDVFLGFSDQDESVMKLMLY